MLRGLFFENGAPLDDRLVRAAEVTMGVKNTLPWTNSYVEQSERSQNCNPNTGTFLADPFRTS